MFAREVFLTFVGFIAIVCCSEHEDFKDHNRPPTYGSQCEATSECAKPFSCLGPADAGAYWPICTVPCDSVSDCPTWNATGHCPGPITPICELGICDYGRCK